MAAIVLFDIDNTLLYTGGAGSAAMTAAFADVYSVRDAFASIEFQGRTDRAIFRDAFRVHGLASPEDHPIDPFVAAYLRRLDALLPERNGHLKPGIPHLLEALQGAGMMLGLATGNLREGAFRKLRYYGLDAYFAGGGFGDASDDRGTVVRQAVAALASGSDGRPVYVVGDTPADIASARANDVFAVGVATGSFTVEQLMAAGAHLALPDLGDIEAVVASLAALLRSAPV